MSDFNHEMYLRTLVGQLSEAKEGVETLLQQRDELLAQATQDRTTILLREAQIEQLTLEKAALGLTVYELRAENETLKAESLKWDIAYREATEKIRGLTERSKRLGMDNEACKRQLRRARDNERILREEYWI